MRALKGTLLCGLSLASLLAVAGCPAPPGPSDGSPSDGAGSVSGSGGAGSQPASNGGGGNGGGGTGGTSGVGGTSEPGGAGTDPGSTPGGGGQPGGGGPPGGGPPGGGPGPNQPPTISLSVAPGGAVPPGASLTLSANAQDPNGDALTFAWATVSGPEVYFANANAETVVGAPLVVENAQVTVSVTANDSRGGSASAEASFLITVAAEFAGHPQSLLPYREQLSPEEAWHFVRRTEFGGPPARVAQVSGQALSATIDQLVAGVQLPQAVLALEADYEFDYQKRWLVRIVEGPNPFHERMAIFWHDRFATSYRAAPSYNDRTMALNHLEMLRRNSLGNYRNFLIDLTLDPLMLRWLDGANSPASSPNENYAREFWELFTLGRDALYTEQDIREAARSFTGITLYRQQWDEEARPIFDIRNHDNTLKSVFPGRTAAANHDYETLIDLTLDQPEAARYVARNLFAYFVHDHPSDALVEQMAAQFEAGGFEIAPLVRQILRSQAFFSSEARRNQILSPIEHVGFAARTLDMHFYREDAQGGVMYNMDNELEDGGQVLLDPPGVQGWAEGSPWLADQWVIQRAEVFLHMMYLDYGPNRTPNAPLHLLPPVAEWSQRNSAARIVDALAAVFHIPLPTEDREIFIDVLNQSGYYAFYLQDFNSQQSYLRELTKLMLMDEYVIVR